jgi:hypothetical protein
MPRSVCDGKKFGHRGKRGTELGVRVPEQSDLAKKAIPHARKS